MHTCIDRTSRRALARRRASTYTETTGSFRNLAWLHWPLFVWSGSSETKAREDLPETLHAALVHRLQAAPRGLYALALTGPESADFRIIDVTGPRLGSAAHTIATMASADAGQQQRWTQRLRLLGECLRGLTPRSSPPQKLSLLDQLAWNLTPADIQAPAAVDRILRKRRSSCLPGTRPAVFEFVLRLGTERLPQFLNALEALAEECHRVDQEPARRRQVLFSILREAAATQLPYLPQFPTAASRRASLWRLNPSFGEAAVKIFLDRHVPESVRRYWPARSAANFTFEKMCRQFVGIEWAPSSRHERLCSAEAPDIVSQLRDRIPVIPASSPEIPIRRVIHLATCFTLLADDPGAPRTIATWMETCRQFTPATGTTDELWQRVISSLEAWATASAREPENLRRLLEILATFSPEMVGIGWRRGASPGAAFHALAGYGALSAEDVLTILDFDLVKPAHRRFRHKPAQLAALLRALPPERRHWTELKPGQHKMLLDLFSGFEEETAVGRLSEWFVHLRRDRGFTFYDVGGFAWKIERIIARKTSERGGREAFLAGHLNFLDRLLDEVETTLRELPEAGFEKWRSHIDLWDNIAGAFEILYEWESAGFGDGAAMFDELMAWCRRDTRKAMVEKWRSSPDHFWDVSRNEAVVVRLSAGSPRRLLRLLERYAVAWNHPDDPFDGWRFLDRYPAVQEMFQRMCEQPRRLHGTMRVLRLIALAVRLQQRAILCAGLDRVVAASSAGDPVAVICGLREIAERAEILPVEVERIRQRQTRLQQECNFLSAMERDGRLTTSAAPRLAKLRRWLQDPQLIARWIDQDSRRAVEKLLLPSQFNAINKFSRDAVRAHWKQAIDPRATGAGGDWDNALHFYYSAELNKSLLRELLRHSAGNHGEWRRHHAPNAKFAEDLGAQGLEIEQWLAPFTMTWEVPGEVFHLHLEQNPLRVLQMGNLFGTCLSLDATNAFSAVANAAEINKQVLYVLDGDRHVIGRKLIGLTADGRMFGFKSYGASCLDDPNEAENPHAWIKVLLDLACLRIVHRLGGQFDRSPDPETAADQLKLSAAWYNDGPEVFDWWIADPDLATAILQNEKSRVGEAVIAHIREKGFPLEENSDDAMGSLRALLWLEDEAATVIASIGRDAIPPQAARFLQGQSTSATVRNLLIS